MTEEALPPAPVLVVGAGLLGTSIGLALRARGVDVAMRDVVPEHVRVATGLGAANVSPDAGAAMVVVAVPPDQVADEVVTALQIEEAVVTDVGSVKTAPYLTVRSAVPAEHLTRYVGSHPMAGSERSGPLAASASLFDGRPWAVTPHASSDARAVAATIALARACGATPVEFTPEEHDSAVARTSHLPHLLAALAAGRLAAAPRDHLTLAGQGVRDVTRIAAGDPVMWQQIVAANATALSELLRDVRADLDNLVAAVDAGDRRVVGGLLEAGVAGTAAIPGKHGGPVVPWASLYVAVPDHPGELARLFADAGEAGVNIEDIRIDHDPARPVGLVELLVADERLEHLLDELHRRGWTAHR